MVHKRGGIAVRRGQILLSVFTLLNFPSSTTLLSKKVDVAFCSFDHGVGHPLLLLYDAQARNYRKNKALKVLGHSA